MFTPTGMIDINTMTASFIKLAVASNVIYRKAVPE
jgi:hypothetical protein